MSGELSGLADSLGWIVSARATTTGTAALPEITSATVNYSRGRNYFMQCLRLVDRIIAVTVIN